MMVSMGLVLLVFGLGCGVKKRASSPYADPYPGVITPAFFQLPVGAVKPEGWLKQTLQAWADGITGHLHEYRSDTFSNTWDNRRYRNKQEQVAAAWAAAWWPFEQQAYWIDGMVQLAYILDDERLKGIADEFIDKILAGQNPDGYLGMTPDDPYSNSGDIYVLSELTLGLMSYYSATEDPRVIPAMQKAFRHIDANAQPLSGGKGPFHPAWHRWPYSCHIIEAILWVYSKTGDQQLLDLADSVYTAMQEVPSDFQVRNLLLSTTTLRDNHGVDVTEILRIPALYALYSGDRDDLNASIKGIESVDRHHGQVHGGPASDEHLREKGPISNTENCVHTTWSYTKQAMFALTGDVTYADGVERILFNVGPGSRTPDGQALQYMTTPNQVAITSTSCNTDPVLHVLRPDGSPVTLCCAGESTRLYPNYVKGAMWLASPDDGLAAACYGPSTVTAKVSRRGTVVTIAEETNYPFEEQIRFELTASKPTKFPLYLRIPGWCRGASITINGELYTGSVSPGQMVKIERRWASGDQIDLHLPMHISFSRGDKASVTVERGPLVYALKIKHNWKKVDERFPGFPDWEVRPGSPWNYALCFDLGYAERDFGAISRSRTPDSYFTIRYPEVPEGSSPWEYPPIELICKGKKVDGWEILDRDVTPDVPQSPIRNDNPEKDVTLIPYGSSRIRITYFPVAELGWK